MEKLEQAKELDLRIRELQEFINLLQKGGAVSNYEGKRNRFTSFSVSADIWTGSDTSRTESKLSRKNEDLIIKAAGAIIPILEKELNESKEQLETLFVQ